MTAVPASDDLRLSVVGARSYFEQHPPPEPPDLAGHDCINWKATDDAQPYRWDFHENGTWFAVDIDARIVASSSHSGALTPNILSTKKSIRLCCPYSPPEV